MNILHFVQSTDLREGGVPRFVLDASRVMAAEGHPSTILTYDTTDSPQAWLDPDSGGKTDVGTDLPSIHRLPRPTTPVKFFGPAAMRQVRRHLRRCDVLHLHCIWSPSTLQVAAAARAMGVPYVVSLHGMLDDWCISQRSLKKQVFLTLGGRYFLEKAARVHCTARAEVDQSKKWFPKGAEAVIPYLMDLEPFRHLPGRALAAKRFQFLENQNEPLVLFLSRLDYKKRPELLLGAAANLRDHGVGCTVALAGTGQETYVQSLKDLSAKLGLEDRVHFLGQVGGADKLSLYQSADLFVLPTSQENFGLVLIEALACGTPLITTKGVDIWKDVERSGAGEIVDPGAAELAASIASLLSDNQRRATMASKARPWVFSEYDEQRLLGKYETMYDLCAATGTSPARREDESRWVPTGSVLAHA